MTDEDQRTSKPFNGLSPADTEVLAILAEECGELVQAVTKILRHGIYSHHPESAQVTNRDLLEKEMGDVLGAMRMVCEAHIADRDAIYLQARGKLARLGRWLHHARPFYVEPGEKIL